MRWTLEIYTWAGLSAGASHYYGELKDEDYHPKGERPFGNKLQRRLTTKEAAAINKKLRFEYREDYYEMYKVKAGQFDYRFETEDDVIAEGIKQFMELAPPDSVLVDYGKNKKVYARKEGK